MCNSYEQHVAHQAYAQMMQALELGIPTQQSDLDLRQADDIRIGDMAPVMRAAGNLVELAQMKFGFPPPRPGASPIFNFRSEGRRFDQSNRCLIPASAFYEFRGEKSPKAKYRFSLDGAPILAIAGIWRDGADGQPPAFPMLTTKPGSDVAPVHDRQIVVLRLENWVHWLYLTRPQNELLRPLLAGSLAANSCGRAAINNRRTILACRPRIEPEGPLHAWSRVQRRDHALFHMLALTASSRAISSAASLRTAALAKSVICSTFVAETMGAVMLGRAASQASET
jgi:putative SOS response-associated peptidase YedK